jgi:hypothetical protein
MCLEHTALKWVRQRVRVELKEEGSGEIRRRTISFIVLVGNIETQTIAVATSA